MSIEYKMIFTCDNINCHGPSDGVPQEHAFYNNIIDGCSYEQERLKRDGWIRKTEYSDIIYCCQKCYDEAASSEKI